MKYMKHSQNFYKFPESTNFIPPMPTLILLIAFFSLPRTHTWNYRIPIIKIRRIRIILFIPAKPPSDKSSPHSLPSRNLSPSNIEDQLFWFSSNGTRICGTLLSFAAAILWRWFVLVRVRVETVATRCFLWNPIALMESRRKINQMSKMESLSSPSHDTSLQFAI